MFFPVLRAEDILGNRIVFLGSLRMDKGDTKYSFGPTAKVRIHEVKEENETS